MAKPNKNFHSLIKVTHSFSWSCSILGSIWIGSSIPQIWTQANVKRQPWEMVKQLALHCSIVEKNTTNRKKMTNLLRNALTSFSDQQNQSTMDHSNVLNMAQEITFKISTLPFHWLFEHGHWMLQEFFWQNSDQPFFELLFQAMEKEYKTTAWWARGAPQLLATTSVRLADNSFSQIWADRGQIFVLIPM